MNKAFVVKIILKKPLNISLCMAILKKIYLIKLQLELNYFYIHSFDLIKLIMLKAYRTKLL